MLRVTPGRALLPQETGCRAGIITSLDGMAISVNGAPVVSIPIATATMLFGLSSGAALATGVGVLIEVPVMLWLVRICLRTQHWFGASEVSHA